MALIRLVVYSNLWIAMGAASLFFAGFHVLGGERPEWRTLIFLMSSTLITYNMHWLLAGRAFHRSRQEEKHQWYAQHYWFGWCVFGLALVGELWGVLGLGWREWLFFAHLGAIAVLYNLPEHRTPGWLVSIRSIPFLKIFLIAYLWTALGAGYPALLLNVLTWQSVGWFWGLFAYILAITLPFDVRDLLEDKKKGVRTLPSILGLKGTKGLAYALLLVFMAGGIESGYGILPTVLLILGAGMGIGFTNAGRHELFFTGFLDGLLVLFGLLIAI